MSLEKKRSLEAMREEEGWLEGSLSLSQKPDSLLPGISVHRPAWALATVAPAQVILDVPALALAIASGVSGVHVGSTTPGDRAHLPRATSFTASEEISTQSPTP